MAKLSTLQASEPQSVMLFGGPFTGKTLLAGQLAEHFDIIFIDLESGHDVLFQLPVEWQKRIEVIALPDCRDFPVAAESIPKITKGPVDICEEHGKAPCFTCKKTEKSTTHLDLLHLPLSTIVIIDSGTQFGNSVEAHLLKDKPEDYKTTFHDWRMQGAALDRFYSRIQIAPYNVVVIAHEIEGITKGQDKKIVPTSGTREFSGNVAKYFNHVVYAEKKNSRHVFASSSTYSSLVVTGSRAGSKVEDAAIPTLLSIFKPEVVPKSVPKIAKPVSNGNKAAALLNKMKAKANGG